MLAEGRDSGLAWSCANTASFFLTRLYFFFPLFQHRSPQQPPPPPPPQAFVLLLAVMRYPCVKRVPFPDSPCSSPFCRQAELEQHMTQVTPLPCSSVIPPSSTVFLLPELGLSRSRYFFSPLVECLFFFFEPDCFP